MDAKRAATLKQIADGAELLDLDDFSDFEVTHQASHDTFIQIKLEQLEETPAPEPEASGGTCHASGLDPEAPTLETAEETRQEISEDSPVIDDKGRGEESEDAYPVGKQQQKATVISDIAGTDINSDVVAPGTESPNGQTASTAGTVVADAAAISTNDTGGVESELSKSKGAPNTNTGEPREVNTNGARKITLGPSLFPDRPTRQTKNISHESLLEQQKKWKQMYVASNPTPRLNTGVLTINSASEPLVQETTGLPEPSALEMEYKQAEREATRMRALGTLKSPQEIALMRLGQKYSAEKKRLSVVTEGEDSDSLFVPTAKIKPKAKGKRKSQEIENNEDEESPPKRARSGKKGTKKGKTATKAKSRKGKKNRDPFANRLMTTGNVIEDASAAQDLEDQPGFDPDAVGKDRTKALRALVANSPASLQKVAHTDMLLLKRALQDFSIQGSVKPAESGLWKVPGMKTSLQPHQVLSTAFLRRRENGTEEPRGGILADTMGLGKTLMLLANIVNGRPFHNSPRGTAAKDEPQTTLIVVPSSLRNQWMQEIRKHTERKARHKGWGINAVMLYCENDAAVDMEPEDLTNNDIVLTTYNEVAKSWPSIEPPEGLTDLEEDEWNEKEFQTRKGLLHRTHFLRVCLDEAHMIRNTDTKVYAGCRQLIANHYWAATGTPMMNGSFDLYALFQFIRHPAVQNSSTFKKKFFNKLDPMSTEKLTEDLKVCMTHASHRDILFGARLVSLPRATATNASLSFTRLEREIYTVVQLRFQQRVQRYIDENTIESKMPHLYVLMLRLRQLTSHCLMISEVLPWLEEEDFERLEAIVKNETRTSRSGKNLIKSIRNLLNKTKLPGEGRIGQDYQDGLDVQYGVEMPSETQPLTRQSGGLTGTGKGHGNNMQFEPYLNILKDCDAYRFKVAGGKCISCHKKPINPWMTVCHHVYCKECLEEASYEDAERGISQSLCKASECDQVMDASPLVMGEAAMDEEAEAGDEAEEGMSRKKKKKNNDPISGWKDKDGEVLASTKSIACKAQILNWWDESAGGDPSQKIIIFSQWIPMMHLLMRMCDIEGWGYSTLLGKQSQKERAKQIQDFTKFPEKRILIASLRCGGTGLNLTMANKVINVEPWWNQATEYQAFCRVFRIGQTRETEMVSLTIKDTIDNKLVKIKESKSAQIDQVMKGHKRLTKEAKKDILSLLGDVEEDANGRLFFTNKVAGESEIEDEEAMQQ